MEGADEIIINTNPLVYKSELGTRVEEGIKRTKKHWKEERMKMCN